MNSGVYCQVDNAVLENITRRFQDYCASFPREEVLVETDREIYIAGEEIRFSVFLFDRQKERLTAESRIAYLEILNPVNRPVLQKRVGLDGGTGSGRAILPDTLSPGIYTLRAYTNWMKNFMPGNCFSRKLKIYSVTGKKNFYVPEETPKNLQNRGSNKTGLNIAINTGRQGIVEAKIFADNKYLDGNNIYYLFVQTHGVINFKSEVTLSGELTSVEIPAPDIIPGINQFTLFDSSGEPVCKAYSYTPVDESDLLHLNVVSSDTCRTRETDSVGLKFMEPYSQDDTAYLAISVVPAGTKAFSGIDMVFASEFGELPDLFNDTPPDNIPDSIMNDFLASAKSSWLDWDIILSDRRPEIKYNRETRYHYLYGKIFDNNETDTSRIHYVFLSVPGMNATFQYSRIAPDGSFSFSLPADDNARDIVIQADEQGKDNKIIVVSSFSDRYPDNDGGGNRETSLPEIVRRLGLNYRVTNIYRSFEPVPAGDPMKLTSGTGRFYGKPDIELIMADYIKLPTMQEVFFELLPAVSLRTGNEGSRITIRGSFDPRVRFNTLLMIDGVVIRDPALIAGVDPELVRKIDVIKTGYIVGDYTFAGLVNIITTKGNMGNITLPGDAVRIRYRAFEPQREFSFPNYSLGENKQSHVPDLRNTMYWNNLKFPISDKKLTLEFMTSDFMMDHDIIVQGVTKKGGFVYQKQPIKIQK
ncbi:MAG: hypothetical protein WCE64_00925 [Bacteroidales bacterium]